jgi:hypothetical protein
MINILSDEWLLTPYSSRVTDFIHVFFIVCTSPRPLHLKSNDQHTLRWVITYSLLFQSNWFHPCFFYWGVCFDEPLFVFSAFVRPPIYGFLLPIWCLQTLLTVSLKPLLLSNFMISSIGYMHLYSWTFCHVNI